VREFPSSHLYFFLATLKHRWTWGAAGRTAELHIICHTLGEKIPQIQCVSKVSQKTELWAQAQRNICPSYITIKISPKQARQL